MLCNANACNGERGYSGYRPLARLVAERLSIKPERVMIASTGIIGQPDADEKLADGIPRLTSSVGRSDAKDMEVAKAIMTTDLVPKTVAASCESDTWSGALKLGGVCKGSGMIAPNMATMLCFITRMPISIRRRFHSATEPSSRTNLQRMTVDGDTSTNDMERWSWQTAPESAAIAEARPLTPTSATPWSGSAAIWPKRLPGDGEAQPSWSRCRRGREVGVRRRKDRPDHRGVAPL